MHGRRYSPDGFLLVFLNVKGNLSSVIMQLKDLFDSKLFGARCLSVMVNVRNYRVFRGAISQWAFENSVCYSQASSNADSHSLQYPLL